MATEQSRPDPVSAIALLDEPTRRRLYELVASSGEPVGRDQAATTLGVSRELAAFHLDRLADAGLLETVFRRLGSRQGPGAGRPAKLYRRSAAVVAVSLPPRDYLRAAEILEDAVVSVDGAPGLDAIRSAARTRGEATGGTARASAKGRPSRRRQRSALLELLRDGGYEPVVDPDVDTIRLRNCPYHDLAQRNREVTCGMNLAWAEGVVGGLGVPGIRAVLAPEPGSCCVIFEADPTSR
ncbi:MAG TPA: helix-turn-helix domain-containing protein [Candidatus Limnocylindrales bacterium]